MTESFIEFYTKHRISPVRQDVRDLQRHFERRASLYRHLGILPRLIKGQRVLEVGPGSGFNALYTASLEPSRYVLIEANPTAVEDIRSLFAEHPPLGETVHVEPVLFEDYEPEPFDLVFCEGMLSGLPDPEAALKRLVGFVSPGGLLTITCVDAVSYFPETLRRLFAQLLIEPQTPLEAQVDLLVPVFNAHLDHLTGMSRRQDDWVIDNLLNPAAIGKLLSIPDAIALLEEDCDIYGASPHFLCDWRWYKTLTGDDLGFNQNAIDQYWQNVHNLIDHRRVFPPRAAEANRRLCLLCQAAREKIQQLETTRDFRLVEEVRSILGELASGLQDCATELGEAFAEAERLLAHLPVDGEALARSVKFGSLFGRGQQYLSFTRKSGS